MGYSDNSCMVRVDFFKPSGKYYTTEAVDFSGLYHGSTVENFERGLSRHLGDRLSGMTAVCIEPYAEHAYPVMVRLP